MPATQKRLKSKSAKRPSGPALLPPLASPADVERQLYSARDVQRLANLPATLILSLERAGHLHPRKVDRKISYSFQDLLVMRTASALRAAQIPAQKIADALTGIFQALPQGSSLTVLSINPIDRDTSAPDTVGSSQTTSEQYSTPFIVDHRKSSVVTLKRRAVLERRRLEAEEHFANALAVEDTDIAAAREGYLAALEAHGGHLEARINLGRLLHINGELAAAEKVYREAKHASALLSFNLAILLEDLGREEEAILSYRDALALDPSLHDAHYNLSQLHERAEQPREALRHLLAYRRWAKSGE